MKKNQRKARRRHRKVERKRKDINEMIIVKKNENRIIIE